MQKSTVHVLAWLLVIVGGLNWGLVGLLDFNLVEMILGGYPTLEKLVYVLVGVSALMLAMTHKDDCMTCSMMMGEKPMMASMPAKKAKSAKKTSRRRK